MDAEQIVTATREYATELANFYRANPTKWQKGAYGNLKYGCCMTGGLSGLYAQHIGSMQVADNQAIADELFKHFHAKFSRVNGKSIVTYNDDVCKTVDDAIAALERVAAA